MTAPFPQAAYEIGTPRLVLRSAVPDDATALYGVISTPENHPFGGGVPPDVSPEVMRARIERWGPETASGKRALLMITLRETGELVGYGGFNRFETAGGEACDVALWGIRDGEGGGAGDRGATPFLTDFGVVLDHRHWGKGYGREAFCAQVEFAIEGLGCGLVRIETDLENEPWRAVMKSVGLGRLEVKRPVSHGENTVGWVYKIDPATWREARENMKTEGKWPL